MGRCRVVIPETVRLPLSEGEWIDVWGELNAGQYVDLLRDLADRKPFAKILAYVLAWSLVGPTVEGTPATPLPWDLDTDPQLRRDTMRSLDKATLREIIAALDRHEAAEEAAITAKKKTTGGEPRS